MHAYPVIHKHHNTILNTHAAQYEDEQIQIPNYIKITIKRGIH